MTTQTDKLRAMLKQADTLEECGDKVRAEALRSFALARLILAEDDEK